MKLPVALPHRMTSEISNSNQRQGRNRMRLSALRDLALEYGIMPGGKRLPSEVEKAAMSFTGDF